MLRRRRRGRHGRRRRRLTITVSPPLSAVVRRRGAYSRRVCVGQFVRRVPRQPELHGRQWRRGRYQSLRGGTTAILVVLLLARVGGHRRCRHQRAVRAGAVPMPAGHDRRRLGRRRARTASVGRRRGRRGATLYAERPPGSLVRGWRRWLWRGAGGGMGSGGVLCRERESRRRPDACEGVGEVSPGECRRDLWPDLRWLCGAYYLDEGIDSVMARWMRRA
ncbi:hypothetical protein BJV78DRAFT_416470 [Lactifluus subvellereus]|nr:hypothetical protein BJV78DRAFT_416470 [Lactifluus subvellereus]